MSEYQPFQLSASTLKPGETLVGDLVLAEGTPELDRVRRVSIRIRGQLEYEDEGTARHKVFPGGPEFTRERPLRGDLRIPFKLSLPPDALPSYQGEGVQISWMSLRPLKGKTGRSC